MEFVVEIFHREIIKPSSSTPLSLQNFKLSLLDQLVPKLHIPLIFWYPNDNIEAADHVNKVEARSHVLKKSLSETLTHFNPFAGRISGSIIECSNEGVDFIETRVNCLLQDILKQPDVESLGKLLPLRMGDKEAATSRLLLVQVNFFECGGMAIAICLSHKIADMSTLKLFTKTWAAVAGGSYEVPSPDFGTMSSLFPPLDLPVTTFEPGMNINETKFPLHRLVFDVSKISMLKDQAASTDVPQPTRVEAVTALIWKCAMAAATSNRGGLRRPSALVQSVNLRKRMNPPVPEYSTGNLLSFFVAQTSDCETELQGLVKQLRNGIRDFSEKSVRKLQGSGAVSAVLAGTNEVKNLLMRNDIDVFLFSSWCRFELYESADFGWGKPRWLSTAAKSAGNSCVLIDSRDGEGIDVWMCLNEAEMAFFKCNHELLAFASVDASVKL